MRLGRCQGFYRLPDVPVFGRKGRDYRRRLEVTVTLNNLRHQHFACWVKISEDDILKQFSYFSKKIGFNTSFKLFVKETICMKRQIFFYEKIRTDITSLSSAEFALSLVHANGMYIAATVTCVRVYDKITKRA